ncbi:hypothetical protein [Alkalihalobacillus sp. CinArs1]|uniref:hypothetical protein n=1 Tax=Alkalihalobacillus sp. CinArs1 TaxID=2995314 RepID=UPI0022DE2948|nr:hypothetical protein [Alkalihalobacillus sp. CinArs1]
MKVITFDTKEDENLHVRKDYDFSNPYNRSRWSVYWGYDFEDGEVDIFGDKEVIIKAKNYEVKTVYDPLEINSPLYLEIAKIHLDSFTYTLEDGSEYTAHEIKSPKAKKSLLTFVEKYGLLGSYQRKYTYTEATENNLISNENKIFNHAYPSEPISDYGKDIYRLKLANSLLKENDNKEKMSLLYNIVNSEQRFIYNGIQHIGDSGAPSIFFSSLLDVAWWQLKQALIGEIDFRYCKHCGWVFAASHGSQKFCPSEEKGKRSKCYNAYSQKMRRTRRKQDGR